LLVVYVFGMISFVKNLISNSAKKGLTLPNQTI
jgi:hypothetical protein